MSAAAILLAAGSSSRLGRPKQLLEFQRETLIERAVRLAQEAGANPLLVVLGAHHEEIWAAVSKKNVVPVINGAWSQGIATSIHAGVRALEGLVPDISGALILTCDQPFLTADHLRALLESFRTQATPCCVASTYAGTRGIPAVFPRSAFVDLYALRGDQGARLLFRDPSRTAVELPFPRGEVDIDWPIDLVHLEQSARRKHHPSHGEESARAGQSD